MPLIWCAISGHGYGHAAQVIPILNELGRRRADLSVHIRTSIPPEFFQNQLRIRWSLDYCEQDVGCVQRGPLVIDVERTWSEYERFHAGWSQRIERETRAMQAVQPDLVLSDISYLTTAAGARIERPVLALGNLSWDRVLLYLDPAGAERRRDLIDHIQKAYQCAQAMMRLRPGIESLPFTAIFDVGPIYGPAIERTGTVRSKIGAGSTEPVVLVACGGVPLTPLPLERLESVEGYQFVVGGMDLARRYRRVYSANDLGLPFCHMFAEADIVITKPGYATIVEAVRYGLPVVYVRRNNFVDEPVLVDYLLRYGRGVELDKRKFDICDWREALDCVRDLPQPVCRPPESGVTAAADIIESYVPPKA